METHLLPNRYYQVRSLLEGLGNDMSKQNYLDLQELIDSEPIKKAVGKIGADH